MEEWQVKRKASDARHRAAGDVLCRADPGPCRWAEWLAEFAEPYVEEMTPDAVPHYLGIFSLGYGLEKLQEKRRQGHKVSRPMDFVLNRAHFHQYKRTVWFKAVEAAKAPHLVIDEDESCESEEHDENFWSGRESAYWQRKQAASDQRAQGYQLPVIGGRR